MYGFHSDFFGNNYIIQKPAILNNFWFLSSIKLIYMFKELNKAKQDIDNFKGFSAQVVRHLAPPPEPVSAPVPQRTHPEKWPSYA